MTKITTASDVVPVADAHGAAPVLAGLADAALTIKLHQFESAFDRHGEAEERCIAACKALEARPLPQALVVALNDRTLVGVAITYSEGATVQGLRCLLEVAAEMAQHQGAQTTTLTQEDCDLDHLVDAGGLADLNPAEPLVVMDGELLCPTTGEVPSIAAICALTRAPSSFTSIHAPWRRPRL